MAFKRSGVRSPSSPPHRNELHSFRFFYLVFDFSPAPRLAPILPKAMLCLCSLAANALALACGQPFGISRGQSVRAKQNAIFSHQAEFGFNPRSGFSFLFCLFARVYGWCLLAAYTQNKKSEPILSSDFVF